MPLQKASISMDVFVDTDSVVLALATARWSFRIDRASSRGSQRVLRRKASATPSAMARSSCRPPTRPTTDSSATHSTEEPRTTTALTRSALPPQSMTSVVDSSVVATGSPVKLGANGAELAAAATHASAGTTRSVVPRSATSARWSASITAASSVSRGTATTSDPTGAPPQAFATRVRRRAKNSIATSAGVRLVSCWSSSPQSATLGRVIPSGSAS
mmetsp:Transcript_51750/g.159482  ORF Transcript_51750/g.159482 Transcript_51750/m.159482 type:complete len:216 (+) Transcript_51750:2-649(+)